MKKIILAVLLVSVSAAVAQNIPYCKPGPTHDACVCKVLGEPPDCMNNGNLHSLIAFPQLMH